MKGDIYYLRLRSDVSRLWAAVTFHGGRIIRELRPNVTHVVASNAHGAKYRRSLDIGENRVKGIEIKLVRIVWLLQIYIH